MSNEDDVLDNWEEIDEAGLDSKLNQINKTRKEPSKISEIEKEQNMSNLAMSFHNGIPMMMVIQQKANEYKSTNYSTEAMCSVKILRRPVQQHSASSTMNAERPKPPIKTLQQREQEYAEARLRILGSAKNPEDDLETPFSKTVELLQSDISQHSNNCKNYAMHGGSAAIKDESLNFPASSSINLRYSQNVLRMPKGPDGTNGFQIPR